MDTLPPLLDADFVLRLQIKYIFFLKLLSLSLKIVESSYLISYCFDESCSIEKFFF